MTVLVYLIITVMPRDATGLRFSEFLQKSESFRVYTVNIADFTQISEYIYCLLKLFHVMQETCFLLLSQ